MDKVYRFILHVPKKRMMIGLMFSILKGLFIWLVVWNIFSIIYGIILPIDFHMFQRGRSTTKQLFTSRQQHFRGGKTVHSDPTDPTILGIPRISGYAIRKPKNFGSKSHGFPQVFSGIILCVFKKARPFWVVPTIGSCRFCYKVTLK